MAKHSGKSGFDSALDELGPIAYTLRFKFPGKNSGSIRFRPMTIDKSLKIKAGSVKMRNVLTRAERLTKLVEADRWSEGDPVYGIPKVRVVKISLKKKKKVKKADDEDK